MFLLHTSGPTVDDLWQQVITFMLNTVQIRSSCLYVCSQHWSFWPNTVSRTFGFLFFKSPKFCFYCSFESETDQPSLLCCWELHSKGGCLEMQSSCQRQWLVVGCHGDWRSRQSVVSSSLACREIAVSCGFRGML